MPETPFKIEFRALSKTFPGSVHPAVDAVTFGVPEGATCMLVGTSGSGKTTLLRMVNRLVEPTYGQILIDGNDVLTQDPIQLRRRIGYVIQQVGLFPHMNVGENIRVTAEIAGGWQPARLEERTRELMDLVGLPYAEYHKRFPRELSGGQQQRVGLARALVTNPSLLLMDEPFGALDAITRSRMQDELLRIQRGVNKTILFVSHDIEEAFKLGNLVAVMHAGKLIQLGTPIELLMRPANDFVRKLVGGGKILRELEYLPVSSAMVRALDAERHQGQNLPTCPPNTSLLNAILQLIETNAPALAVQGTDAKEPLGYITLASLTGVITQANKFAAGLIRSSDALSDESL